MTSMTKTKTGTLHLAWRTRRDAFFLVAVQLEWVSGVRRNEQTMTAMYYSYIVIS